MAIGKSGRRGAVVYVEQTARAALGERRLRDQLGRQIKIEVGKREHGESGSMRDETRVILARRLARLRG
jgi:hypothetical protein